MYTGPTSKRIVLYEWSHESPDTVLHYNIKILINKALIYNATLPNGTYKDYRIVGQGELYLEIEAVGLCGHSAKHVIYENDIDCK